MSLTVEFQNLDGGYFRIAANGSTGAVSTATGGTVCSFGLQHHRQFKLLLTYEHSTHPSSANRT